MVATRSATGALPLQKGPKPYYGDSEDENHSEDQVEEDEEVEERPRKRTKRKRPSLKGNAQHSAASASGVAVGRGRRQGKLASIMNLPVEVFCEIASNMAPVDLLRLARSSKLFWKMFMSRSSKVMWKAAEDGMGLPDCPSDLSSPQYASLAFEKFCMVCGITGSRVSKYDSILRYRLCKDCFRDNVLSGYTISNSGLIPEELKVYQLVPSSEIFATSPEANYFVEIAQDYMTCSFYKPEVIAAVKAYLAVEADLRPKFLEERKTLMLENLKLAEQLEDWFDTQREKRSADNHQCKLRRRNCIFEKLRELGYGQADLDNHVDDLGWKWNILINQPRELTDRIWNNIRPKLEETIHLRREKLLRIKRQHTMDARKSGLQKHAEELFRSNDGPAKDCCMSIAVFYALPHVARMINEKGWEERITLEQWSVAKDALLEGIKACRRNIEFDCITALSGASKVFQSKVKGVDLMNSMRRKELLGYAIALFQHPTDSENIATFSDVLKDMNNKCLETFRSSHHAAIYNDLKASSYKASEEAIGVAIALLHNMCFPEDISMNYMDSLEESFICNCCPERKSVTWRSLVSHFWLARQEHQRTVYLNRKGFSSTPYVDIHELKQSKRLAECRAVGWKFTMTSTRLSKGMGEFKSCKDSIRIVYN